MSGNKHISSDELIGAKEVLKGMPDFYKKVYFPSHYIEESNKKDGKLHESILVLAKRRDLNYLRGYLQRHFMYDRLLDSLEFKDEDYGFSFRVHNIKYVVGAIVNNEEKTTIKLFDTTSKEGIIYDYKNPENLLGLFTNPSEEKIKVCNIDMEDFNKNSQRERLIQEEMVVESTSGKISTLTLIALIVIAIVVNIAIYMFLH